MIHISRSFLIALKLADTPQYKVAQEAGLHPAQLSRIVRGIDKIYPNDRRVIAIGKVLGLAPGECFEDEKMKHSKGKTILTGGRDDRRN